MKSLERTAVGPFNTSNAVSLDLIKKLRDDGREDELMNLLMPVDSVFPDLAKLTVCPDSDRMLLNGNKLTSDDMKEAAELQNGERFRVYHPDGSFAAVYEYDSNTGVFRPYRMF